MLSVFSLPLAAGARALVLMLALGVVLAPGIESATAQPASDEKRMFSLFRQGKHAACIALCRKMLKAGPDRASARHVLGRSLLATGKLEDARRELDRCLALKPAQGWMVQWTHVSLGQCYLSSGDAGVAGKHLNRAIAIGASRNATQAARNLLARIAGQALPDFRFRTLDGAVFDRDAVRGHPVMFKFGPSW